MPDGRVAITGIGIACAAGVGRDAYWQAMQAGQSRVGPLTQFDPASFPSRIAGQIEDFSARKFVPKSYRKSVKVMARDIEIAVAAADLAFRDAGMITRGIEDADAGEPIAPERLACNIGAGLICADLDELAAAINTAVDEDGRFSLRKWGESGLDNLTPLWLLKYLPNMLSCHVTIIHGAEGPSNCITCGDASGHLAVGESRRIIAAGRADAAVAGGAESKVNPMGLLRQCLLNRACTTGNEAPADAIRPFDAEHAGTAVGEGGALMILEDLQRARDRGATIFAEVVGFGAACDPAGTKVTQPQAGSLRLAARRALSDAGIDADEVDLLVAHGSAVPGEDEAETDQWREVFGDRLAELPAVAITGLTGSLYAGAGALELATAALALHHGQVPPTVNYSRAAQRGGLNLASSCREASPALAMTGSFTVGGQSAAAVLKRYEP